MALSLELLGLLGVNLEDTNDDVLVGGNIIDVLSGGDGDDVIEGKGGADVITGGDGIDTLSYETSPAAVTVDLTPGLLGLIGLNSGGDATGDVVSIGFENVVGSAFADTLTGDATGNTLVGMAGDDTLDGGGGNDLLIGGAGADRMDGGAGVDTVNYVDSTAGVTVNLATGVGSGGAAQNDTLLNLENVVGTRFADILIGNAADNSISGGLSDDSITGGAGKDTIEGGGGHDTASYATSSAAVTVNLITGINTGGDAAGDVLTTIENLTGSLQNDKLTGNNITNVLNGNHGDDILIGNGGDDILIGGIGADNMDGGSGIDTVNYSSSSAAVTVNLATNLNTGGQAAGDSIINVENVAGTGFSDHITGSFLDNVLTGLNGNDVLNGGAGDDLLYGGWGADTLIGGSGIDGTSYTGSAAAVTVNLVTGTGIGGFAQGDTLNGIENVSGSAFADVLTGDGNNNSLLGNAGNDVLDSGAGNDSLRGGAGADTLDGGAGQDSTTYDDSKSGVNVNLTTGVGIGGYAQGDLLLNIESVIGSKFNDTLVGTDGHNELRGLQGNDVLRGDGGSDLLQGGSGADKFVYTDVSDSRVGVGSGVDTISDFRADQGDKIDLSAIDANTGTAGDQAFALIGTAAFSHVAGQLRFDVTATGANIQADINGDGVADLIIHAAGITGFTASDFVL